VSKQYYEISDMPAGSLSFCSSTSEF